MTTEEELNQHEVKMEQGIYNERIEKNSIHAHQVIIYENFLPNRTDGANCGSPNHNGKLNVVSADSEQQNDTVKIETGEHRTTDKVEAIVVLTTKLSAANKAQLQDKEIEIEAIVAYLEQHLGDQVKLTIKYVKEGSIRIGLEGSLEDLKKLEELFKTGELTEVLGIPIENIHLVITEPSDDEEEIKTDDKSRLVQEIVNQGAVNKDLSFVDLSDGDLSGSKLSGSILCRVNLSNTNLRGAYLNDAYLIGVNLRNADLRNADLRNADLRNADLRNADLRNADLSGANFGSADLSGVNFGSADLRGVNLRKSDLRGADLRGVNLRKSDLRGVNLRKSDLSEADLSEADLSEADVEDAKFIYNLGIPESMKRNLIQRGAIFEDSSSDRSPVHI